MHFEEAHGATVVADGEDRSLDRLCPEGRRSRHVDHSTARRDQLGLDLQQESEARVQGSRRSSLSSLPDVMSIAKQSLGARELWT